MLDLTSLNERQKEAVCLPLGPALVLAGAGSGKTRVLAYRIAYLVEQGLVPGANILALTFTNKAAKEMQQRVNRLLSNKTQSGVPTMGTFHSVGARILRREIPVLGYSSSFIIYDADDSLKVIKEVCQELAISSKFSPTLFRSFISTAKNMAQTPAEFAIGLEAYMQSLAAQVYARYQDYLFRQNALDFDDLLMLPIRLFQARRDILIKYQQLFQYILVDEYQDTNEAQYLFLKLLVQKGGGTESRALKNSFVSSENLFVVGDDAQSIYGFRGSNIRNILNFEKDFPTSKVITLDQNYRSTGAILAAAQKVIELNANQKPKTLWTENEQGDRIVIRQLENEEAEAEFVAERIIKLSSSSPLVEDSSEYVIEAEEEEKPFSILDQFLKKNKTTYRPHITVKLPVDHSPLSHFAVLYRTHAQSRSLEEVFIAAGIPYQIVGGVKFYERKEIKDLLAYVRLIVNWRDMVSLKRVINIPARGIGEKSYEIVKDCLIRQPKEASLEQVRASLTTATLPAKSHKGVLEFFDLLLDTMHTPETFTLLDILQAVIKRTKFESYLKDGTEVGETRFENVQELLVVASQFSAISWQEGAIQFLEEVSLFTDIDTVENEKDAVTFMTLHSAKGLEFETVFFVGLEEGVLPHSRSLLNPDELEEEIRLAYVGLTRAQKRLFLTHARTRNIFGTTQVGVPSRILRALSEDGGRSSRKNANSPSLNDGTVSYETMDF